MPESILLKKEVNNLEKVFKILQSLTKTILFLLLAYYKFIWLDRERNIQYWNKIMTEFIKQEHNIDTSHWGFPIEMYIGESPYELFFIVLIL